MAAEFQAEARTGATGRILIALSGTITPVPAAIGAAPTAAAPGVAAIASLCVTVPRTVGAPALVTARAAVAAAPLRSLRGLRHPAALLQSAAR